jgi:hypothetical protein
MSLVMKKSRYSTVREYPVSNDGLAIRSTYAQRELDGDTRMTKCTLLGVVAILSTAIATPVLAQAVIQEPGVYAFYRPNDDLGISSTTSQQREVGAVARGTADAIASTSPVRSLIAGNETRTRPWSAPVGHRQPRAADVPTPTSASQQILDQEDADVDRIVRNVCRGC